MEREINSGKKIVNMGSIEKSFIIEKNLAIFPLLSINMKKIIFLYLLFSFKDNKHFFFKEIIYYYIIYHCDIAVPFKKDVTISFPNNIEDEDEIHRFHCYNCNLNFEKHRCPIIFINGFFCTIVYIILFTFFGLILYYS